VIHSLQNITPKESCTDFDQLKSILTSVAHLSHKDWAVTGENSELLHQVLLQEKGMTDQARQVLERILKEGNWDGAAAHVCERKEKQCNPWAVLVTGVNGIRRTTSMYQPWFPKLLKEALVCPPNGNANGNTDFDLSVLPSGTNSFFRQLDHMIATLCNEDFLMLYTLTAQIIDSPEQLENPPKEVVQKYSDLKAAIFTRYRTLSELLGALLLNQAQQISLNCLLETSGKDVAMFHYIDHFFPATGAAADSGYNKLALHFQINDLTQAQASVDARMVREIQTGLKAIQTSDAFDIIYANAGGPYGSEVLPGVQEASDKVWNEVVLQNKVGQDWYKATIQVNAYPDKAWTAQAIRPDGTLGTLFEFQKL
jgi:hypothetical protein